MTTTTDTASSFTIDELSINRPLGMYPAETLTWERNSELAELAQDHCQDYGRVLVRLSVDGDIDMVEAYTARTSDIEALDRAIVAMQEIRAALTDLGHSTSGACMATGEQRCRLQTGHDGPHKTDLIQR